MKVKELIEVLDHQDPELTVALFCDHGQETMKVTGTGPSWVISTNDHMMEEIEPDELEDHDDFETIFVLEAF